MWAVTLVNRSGRQRTVDIIAATAFDLNGYAQPVYYSTGTTSFTEYVERANAVFNENRNPYRPHDISSGYIMSSERLLAYEGNYGKSS